VRSNRPCGDVLLEIFGAVGGDNGKANVNYARLKSRRPLQIQKSGNVKGAELKLAATESKSWLRITTGRV
jgi:hypothetical protein